MTPVPTPVIPLRVNSTSQAFRDECSCHLDRKKESRVDVKPTVWILARRDATFIYSSNICRRLPCTHVRSR